MSTELKLIHWRDGQTKAERLCAHVLTLDGFSSVDPQCPLGGPDGLKDVKCEKNGWKYIGAAYFPPIEQNFRAIKSKFENDLKGVAKNGANGIIFLTNQHITPSQRSNLEAIARAKSHTALIYHRERMRLILDSPMGFGVRLEYLGVEMSREEQVSFFSSLHTVFPSLLQQQSDYIISALSKKIDLTTKPVAKMLPKIQSFIFATQSTASTLLKPVPPSNKVGTAIPATLNSFSTKKLTIQSLCKLHLSLSHDRKDESLGKMRRVRVWIGGTKPENARFVPPPSDQVPKLLKKLLDDWRSDYDTLVSSNDKNRILDSIILFHHRFVTIHPFLDGNGRIARLILSKQVNELLGVSHRVVIEDKAPYFDSLNKADAGDFSPLKRVITQVIYGQEEIDD